MLIRRVADLSGSAIFLGPAEDLPAPEAIRLIEQGKAIPTTPPIERAVKTPRERR